MGLPIRKQAPFRFTEEQKDRLEKVADFKGLTTQAFVLAIVMKAVEEGEAEMDINKARRKSKRDEKIRTDQPVGLGISSGLGLGFAKQREIEQPAPQPQSQSQVVVNVGQPNANDNKDMIESLAKWITEHNRKDHERLRQAVEILRASGKTEDERTALAKKLDEAVAARVKEEPNALAAMYQGIQDFLK